MCLVNETNLLVLYFNVGGNYTTRAGSTLGRSVTFQGTYDWWCTGPTPPITALITADKSSADSQRGFQHSCAFLQHRGLQTSSTAVRSIETQLAKPHTQLSDLKETID